jgi:hypothetical protein
MLHNVSGLQDVKKVNKAKTDEHFEEEEPLGEEKEAN